MRRILLFIAFCMYIQNAISQTGNDTIQLVFELRDSKTRMQLNSVTCRISTFEGKFYKYAISDKDGWIGVNVNRNDSIEFLFIGYKSIKAKASQYVENKNNDIFMRPDAVHLKEVYVKAPAIRSKGDTLVYHVSAFTKDGDKHLNDILKKLPGIKVAENGSISYQGKAINKFYIEGKDLLGMNYNQATNNMPVEAISDVEILENHQPVRMLENKQISDKAAINIKLDNKHKLRVFGEAESAVGDASGMVWDGKLFATEVSKKAQTLVVGKTNNIGKDLSDETREHIDMNNIYAYEPTVSSNVSTDISMEQVPQNRYVFNKSYSLGINHLVGLSKNATLRCNMLFYHDKSHTSNFQENFYRSKETTVRVAENNYQIGEKWSVSPILKYELNAKNVYIADELRYDITRSMLGKEILSDNKLINQSASCKPNYIQNYATFSFPLGNNFVQGNSFVRYFRRTEHLESTAEEHSVYACFEKYRTHSLVFKNRLSSSLKIFRNILEIGAQINYRCYKYLYDGSNERSNFEINFLPSYSVKYGIKNYMVFDGTLKYFYNSLEENKLEERRTKHKVYLCPKFSWKQYLGSKMYLSASCEHSVYNTPQKFLSIRALRTDYRTFTYHLEDLSLYSNNTCSFRLAYKDFNFLKCINSSSLMNIDAQIERLDASCP